MTKYRIYKNLEGQYKVKFGFFGLLKAWNYSTGRWEDLFSSQEHAERWIVERELNLAKARRERTWIRLPDPKVEVLLTKHRVLASTSTTSPSGS